MSEIEYGGIYWVSFAASIGHEFRGKRPAVVVQSALQLRRANLVTVMPLTSQIGKPHGDDILVKANGENKLYGDSLIKVHSIESFDRGRFLKKIGYMESSGMKKVKEYLRIHFDL